MTREDRLLVLALAIKTADLGYLSKEEAYVQKWTDRILEEVTATPREPTHAQSRPSPAP